MGASNGRHGKDLAGQARFLMSLAVVLLSGGLDSCVTAALAAEDHYLALLHLRYGQRTEARERRAFEAIADHYGVPAARRLVVDTGFLAAIGGSALTDPAIPVPTADPNASTVPVTYVPFRNAHLLSLGVSWAETLGADAVYIGVVQEDSSGYPDCTEAFCRAFGEAARTGTKDGRIRVETPIIHRDKAEIVTIGTSVGAPLHLTWSCYANETEACGICDSCALRLRAFERAGITDPIPYA